MTMPNDINELDKDDIGLKSIFGDRFIDETTAEPVKESCMASSAKADQKPTRKYEENCVDAEWHPEKPALGFYEKLRACAKSTLLFGGLNLLIFYWQEHGLMAASIALPCMCVCAGMVGLGIGKHAKRG